MKTKGRRWRVLWVSPEMVMQSLFPMRYKVEVKLVDGPPDGVEVSDVTYSWERQAFGFRLYHPSFDEVPEGEFSPTIEAIFTTENRSEHRGREFI